MAKKIIKKKKPSYNLTEMQNTQIEFANIKAQKKQLEDREKELRDRLELFMERTFEADSKGHKLFTTIGTKGEKLHLQRQSVRKIELNLERAIEYLSKNGHADLINDVTVVAEDVTKDQIIEVLENHAEHLTDIKTVVDEGALEQLVLGKKIPMKEFEALCDIEQSFRMAFVKDALLEVNN